MSQQNKLLSALVNRMSGTIPANSITGVSATVSEDPPTKVNDKIRSDWNKFVNFLEKKGVKGKPELDMGGLGYKYFDEFVKSNPNTSLRRETIPEVRKELLRYRQSVLDDNKAKIAKLGKAGDTLNGLPPEKFMVRVVENEKSQDPNYPGQHLTSIRFPDELQQEKLVVKNPLTGKSDTTILSTRRVGYSKPIQK